MAYRELEVEIAQDMQNAGLGIFATTDPTLRTIFIGEMPDSVEDASGTPVPIVEGIILIPVPSPPPHQYIDTEYPVIDFWARSPHSDRAKALLRAVDERYHRRAGYSTTNWHIYFSRSLGTIVDVDRDSNAGKLFRLSVQFLCRNLTHVS